MFNISTLNQYVCNWFSDQKKEENLWQKPPAPFCCTGIPKALCHRQMMEWSARGFQFISKVREKQEIQEVLRRTKICDHRNGEISKFIHLNVIIMKVLWTVLFVWHNGTLVPNNHLIFLLFLLNNCFQGDLTYLSFSDKCWCLRAGRKMQEIWHSPVREHPLLVSWLLHVEIFKGLSHFYECGLRLKVTPPPPPPPTKTFNKKK